MPYIEIKTNKEITAEDKITLKSALADALSSSFPGKTENWLMISFMPGCDMFFGGSDAPCMMVDVDIFGKQSNSSYDKMTAKATEILSEKCSVSPDRIYIKYSEFSNWGMGGSNF